MPITHKSSRHRISALVLLLIALPVFAVTPAGLPDRAISPGAVDPMVTQENIHKTICVPGYTRSVRPPEFYTERIKRREIAQYGYHDTHLRDYEEDHIVPLEVGGAPSNPQNLYPEPRYGMWTAAMKDKLENEVHWLVCHGRLSLKEGREIFIENWEEGYNKYVLPRLKKSDHQHFYWNKKRRHNY